MGKGAFGLWLEGELDRRDEGLGHRILLRLAQGFQEADCLLYTSDAADERSSVDLGGRRIIKTKKTTRTSIVCSNDIQKTQ